MQRMRRALDEYVVRGIETNLAFHRRCFRHPAFIAGDYDTGFIERHKAELAPGDALIFYTDGLTDAYAPARPVTADDIAAALPPYAGGSATEIIEAVSRAALPPQNGKSPRDDILVLVLRLES